MTPEQIELHIERLGMENGSDWPTAQSVRDSLTVANIVGMFGESEDDDDPTEDQDGLDEIAEYFIETRHVAEAKPAPEPDKATACPRGCECKACIAREAEINSRDWQQLTTADALFVGERRLDRLREQEREDRAAARSAREASEDFEYQQ